MKIDRLFVVTRPTESSTKADVCFSTDVKDLALQFAGGLKPEEIHGVYSTPEEADREGNRILAAAQKYYAALANRCEKVPA